MTNTCPKCGSERIHRSHRRGVAEHLFSIGGLKSRRCHECTTRFVTLGNSVLFRQDLDRLLKKISLLGMAALAILVVVTMVLWLSRKEANPSASAHAPARYGAGAGRSSIIGFPPSA